MNTTPAPEGGAPNPPVAPTHRSALHLTRDQDCFLVGSIDAAIQLGQVITPALWNALVDRAERLA